MFGEGEETFASVVAKALVAKKLTLAVAESCTGGLVGHLLTREAGASEYLLVDAITYANEAKTRFADVSEEPDTRASIKRWDGAGRLFLMREEKPPRTAVAYSHSQKPKLPRGPTAELGRSS